MNVALVEGDARNIGLPRESFDFVHVRSMLVFGHADAVLCEMTALARPGGIIAVEETD